MPGDDMTDVGPSPQAESLHRLPRDRDDPFDRAMGSGKTSYPFPDSATIPTTMGKPLPTKVLSARDLRNQLDAYVKAGLGDLPVTAPGGTPVTGADIDFSRDWGDRSHEPTKARAIRLEGPDQE
jgi:hypothetical protein